jgi:ribosomal protein S18 acetylase RimI-like enzyme
VRVERLDPAELDVLRPAWLALVAHHDSLDVGMGPIRGDDEVWERRRGQYAQWLATDPAAIFLAREADAVLGYIHVRPTPAWGSRLSTDPTIELETMSVMPDARGRGAGRALWAAAKAHLREHGSFDVTVGAVTANTGAIAFYRRAGFRPFVSTRWAMPVPAWPVPPDVPIEPVGPDDVDRLEPLHRALCERHDAISPSYLPRRRDPAEVWLLERGRHGGGDRFVLRSGDDAYALCETSERGYALWDNGPVGTVEALVARAGARGRGVGAALLHAAARELAARGCRALDLQVLEGNDAAERFYEREGLRRVYETLYARVD